MISFHYSPRHRVVYLGAVCGLLVLVIVAMVAQHMRLQRVAEDMLRTSWHLTRPLGDWPLWQVKADGQGYLYALYEERGKLIIVMYNPECHPVWQRSISGVARYRGVVLFLPRSKPVYVNRYGYDCREFLLIRADHLGIRQMHKLQPRLPLQNVQEVLLVDNLAYVTGEWGHDENCTDAIVGCDITGAIRWHGRCPATANDYLTFFDSDADGNVIVGGSGAAIGKYSRQGRQMWMHGSRGDVTIDWACSLRDGSAVAVVWRDYLTSEGRLSPQTQKFELRLYDAHGKLKRRTPMFRGGRNDILDAAKDSRGNVYLLTEYIGVPLLSDWTYPSGMRVLKCSPKGEILCSYRVKLPSSYTGTGIAVGAKNAVYVYGYYPTRRNPDRSERMKPFICKIDTLQ